MNWCTCTYKGKVCIGNVVLSNKDGLVVRLDEDDKTRLVHWDSVTVHDTLDSCLREYIWTVYGKFEVHEGLEEVLFEHELKKLVGRFPRYFSFPRISKHKIHKKNSKKV